MEAGLLNIEQVAALLNVKVSKIRSIVFYRRIKYIKVGKLIRFKMEDLKDFIEKNTKETVM